MSKCISNVLITLEVRDSGRKRQSINDSASCLKNCSSKSSNRVGGPTSLRNASKLRHTHAQALGSNRLSTKNAMT